jgi:hypothetical protein
VSGLLSRLFRRNAIAGGVLLLLIPPRFPTAHKRSCVRNLKKPSVSGEKMPLWQAKGESQNFPEQLVGVLQVLSMEAETEQTTVRMEKEV